MSNVEDKPVLPTPDGNKPTVPISKAMMTLCAYYKEFLETDFKKVRTPKRRYALRDSKNSRIGVRIERFSQFRSLISGKLEQQTATVRVSPRKYRADLSKGVQAGIVSAIDKIETDRLLSSGLAIPTALLNKHKETANIDEATVDAKKALGSGMQRVVVSPLIALLEPIFGSDPSDDAGDRQLAAYTEEIVERLLDEVAESLPIACADLLVKSDSSLFEQIVRDMTDEQRVKLVLHDYFEHFGAADLFVDVRELVASRQTLENTTIYLNVGEIQYKTHKFPLYYIPLDVEFEEASVRMEFQSFVYVNKPACDYIAGELTRAIGRVVPNPVSERIFHQEDSDTFLDLIERTQHRILAGLQCNGELDFTSPATHFAEGEDFRISNDLSLSLADNADEAIVNDYELLMSGLDPENPLVLAFESLIGSFLSKNPISLEADIDSIWRESSVPDRLVFESPLPLAEEQRKLMEAVHHKKSRMIVVEGPPGCGKSHSLAALAFDVIREGKNVLILSDKKEALDVVESKLNAVFERVRGEEGEYVNPVLRLGKDSANYAKIVKPGSIQKIKTALQSFKTSESAFNDEFESIKSEMVDGVSARIEVGKSLDLRQLGSYFWMEDEYRDLVPALDHFTNNDIESLDALSRFFALLDKHRSFFSKFLSEGDQTQDLAILQRLGPAIGDVSEELQQFLLKWPNINLERAEELQALQREVVDMKQAIFGYLFRRKQLSSVSRTAREILGDDIRDVRAHSDDLLRAAKIRKELQDILRGRAIDGQHFQTLHSCVCARVELAPEEYESIELYLSLDHDALSEYDIPVTVIELLSATEADQRKLTEFISLRQTEAAIASKFNEMPDFDYLRLKRNYEDFCAKRITKHIDERVVHFVEARKNDAKTLRDIVRSKSKFPIDKFSSLREAFPVMIAGLRDYANYIPLEQGLFDLVIIDEASQVSIAQALPAILRSKKTVLMGDRQQFSNVKAAQASKALNNAYFDEVRGAFDDLEEDLDSALATRLKNLDVTKSVMDFGEMTSEYMIMLRKHFRGYPEIISFSSEHFYGGALQVLKLRGKPIDDVLEFVVSENPDRFEDVRNANTWEAEVILERLEYLLETESPPTVAVITPFREQQRLVNERVMNHPKAHDFRDRLKLAVFTADTCQGEERELIFYSMVSTREHDRLNYIFPSDLSAVAAEDAEGKLKVQRLNVAFSRGQEKLVFLCSKPIGEFKGAARQVLEHYKHVLDHAKTMPSVEDTDSQSPMEAHVLEWLASTAFFTRNQGSLEIISQFPIGDYLKSIDPSYSHPSYKVDFLLRLRTEDSLRQVIVEYDGFEFHFERQDRIDSSNWQHYLLEADVEREAVLEGYGYKMIRVNRFNLGDDPISVLDDRLSEAFELLASAENKNEILSGISEQEERDRKGLAEGTHKKCSTCGAIKPTSEFRDPKLKSGFARSCTLCKRESSSGRQRHYTGRSRRR